MAEAPPAKQISPSMARALAQKVITHYFGTKPMRIVSKAGGLSNLVFLAKHADGSLIVRLSTDPGRINSYIKEQWATARVKKLGVPTPEILEVGNEVISYPHMIMRYVAGHEASFHPNRMAIIKELGSYAALINSVKTEGFGSTFDWSKNKLSRNKTWLEFLKKELELDERLTMLRKHKLIGRQEARKLAAALRGVARQPVSSHLTHGDLRLKNVLVSPKGAIASIIDWENCLACIAPHWELSVALHDLTIDEKESFINGYKISGDKFSRMAPGIKAINMINYAPEIKRLAEAKDFARIAMHRVRFEGGLDLYSL
jgi:hygromycin-B 4-O-kinase